MDNTNDFNKLEKAVLEWIEKEYNDPNLIEQIQQAKFVKRNWTKVGFYVYFEVPRNLAPLNPNIIKSFPIGNPVIESDDIELCGTAMLWGRDGYIHSIEMVSFGNFFNENVHDFKFYDLESYNELQRQKREK